MRIFAGVTAGAMVGLGVYAMTPAVTERFSSAAQPTIFVSVASYRDADCAETLRSMFGNARDASRVFAGVCEQNTADAAEACVPGGFEWHAQVRRISIPHGEAKGPTYARYLCSTLYRGETYFCQVDSHTRFAPGWDARAVRMLASCPSPRPVLTHYPHDFDTPESRDVPVLCKARFDDNGVPVLDAVTLPAARRPRPVPFTSGGFVFGPGSMVTEVPYDPDLPHLFQGEEILYSARLWTSGYDFFTPTRNLVYHRYHRADAPKFWSDIDYEDEQQRTLAKVRRLLAGGMAGYPHGMGTRRGLREYYDFAGIDFGAKSATSEAKFCLQ